MTLKPGPSTAELERLQHDEFQDALDEELELELDDARMGVLQDVPAEPTGESGELERRFYFTELLRLQGELVKLQDWSCTAS
jgi:polyphosphate kinase